MRIVVVTVAGLLMLTSCGDRPVTPSPVAGDSSTLCPAADCGAEEPEAEVASEQAAAPVGGLGETIRFRDSAGTVGEITLHKIRRIPVAEGRNGISPTSGSFLIADIEVTIEEGVSIATPLTFEARDPDGNEYVSKFGVVVDRLDRAKLTAGQRVRGDVAFDVPEGEWLIDYEVFDAPLATFQVVG